MSQIIYAGWAVIPPVKEQLLRMCEPAQPVIRCEHILMQPVPAYAAVPPPAQIVVQGMFEDSYAQALVVSVNGVVARPADGFLFHLVISHAQGYPADEMLGEVMQAKAQLVHQVSPWPILGCQPFVRPLILS